MSYSPIGGLSSNSKKIKKSDPSTVKKDCSTRKYKTFDTLQKEKVLSDLRTGIVSILKLDPHHEALYTQDFVEILAQISIDDYNRLIKQIFSKQFEGFDLTSKGYTQWRKKIRNWILNVGKPETRGGLVVSINKANEFKSKVIEIVQSLSYKSFNGLKEKVLSILEAYHYETQDPSDSQPFNNKTCSKHWWFNFMAKNPDVKEIWDSLPLTAKAASQQKSRAMSQASTHEDTVSVSLDYLSDARSPVHDHIFACSITDEDVWTAPSLKDLSAIYESSEAYLKSLCISFENFEDEQYHHQQQNQGNSTISKTMEEEKGSESTLSFDVGSYLRKENEPRDFSPCFAMLGDEDRIEFERENDGVGQIFSQLLRKNFVNELQDLSSRAENDFCLFRTQEH